MHLLNNKLFVHKNYSKKKTGGETRVNSFKCIFRKSTVKPVLLGPFKSGRLGQNDN